MNLNCTDETREALKRIVMVLLALAGLAEKAATARPAARRSALFFIHRAEIAAFGLLTELPVAFDPAALLSALEQSASYEDSLILASRLRLLSLSIFALLMGWQWEPARAGPDIAPPLQAFAHIAIGTDNVCAPRQAYADTS